MKTSYDMYEQQPFGKCTVTGMVYKVTESEYGYRLYIKKGFFDRKRLIISSDVRYDVGTEIKVQGEYKPFSEVSNPGEFDTKKYYNSQKIYSSIKAENIEIINSGNHLIYSLSDKISRCFQNSYRSILDSKYSSVYEAMILGKKDDLDKEISDLFSASGIGHILAISGVCTLSLVSLRPP